MEVKQWYTDRIAMLYCRYTYAAPLVPDSCTFGTRLLHSFGTVFSFCLQRYIQSELRVPKFNNWLSLWPPNVVSLIFDKNINNIFLIIYYMKMYRDKSCYNSFCEPAATERRSKKLTDYHRCNGVFDTDFFDFCFFDAKGF